MMLDVLKDLFELVERGEPAALVTVVETLGSSPARTGFKMLVDREGRRAGTVGVNWRKRRSRKRKGDQEQQLYALQKSIDRRGSGESGDDLRRGSNAIY